MKVINTFIVLQNGFLTTLYETPKGWVLDGRTRGSGASEGYRKIDVAEATKLIGDSAGDATQKPPQR